MNKTPSKIEKDQRKRLDKLKAHNSIKKQIGKLTDSIFNKVLQEEKPNTRIGVTTIRFLWLPHNYRLAMTFKQQSKKGTPLSTPLKNAKVEGLENLLPTISNYGSKLSLKNFKGITIMRDKTKITAIYPNDKWILVEAKSIEELDKLINLRVLEIENICLNAIKDFVLIYGGEADYQNRYWSRHEDKIHGDEFLDSIEPKLTLDDTYFKKVYKHYVEFKSPLYVKNYISNRAIESIAPEIASKLDEFIEVIKLTTKATKLEIKNKRLHENVLNNMNLTLESIREEFRKPFFIRWLEWFRK